MPVPTYYAGTGKPYYTGSSGSGTYSGLGSIYQYGHQMPAGPYSFLPNASGSRPTNSTSSSSSSTGGSSGGEAFFNSVLSGDKLPFSPTTRTALSSKASDMTAAAEAANNATLNANAAAGGASANDPSLQAARLGNQAARQTQNVTNEREIDTQANQANFGAQMNAAESLNRNQLSREALQSNNTQAAMSFLPWNQRYQSSQSTPNNTGYWGFYNTDDYRY